MVMNMLGIEILFKAKKRDNMHPIYIQECALKMVPNCTVVCPTSFAQKCGLVLDILGLKGSSFTLHYQQ
jgi:uncharacterized membrane protein